ncbi:gamma-glutamylcyclotransferase [Pollutimonas subterranea]|uniref:glutathione-specific gamma-glutamylcyclotransferase n=1 Tax=Pollutimonas subterranea TaxID=2045210 RepID=A0A2N4U0H6_9BURK|nr:gamma-glutamylcyclotransferase [Pollutimonas subterranea]
MPAAAQLIYYVDISHLEPCSCQNKVTNTFAPAPHAAAAPSSFRLLTEAERHASMLDALSGWNGDEDVWIYGYGSLIWRPEFQFIEQRAALLHGYHRALCLWSRVNRGTPDKPGLVFGLDVGGSCRGMAYRIPAGDVPSTMEALWRREMPSGAYIPRWLRCRTDHGIVSALTFTMNRYTDAYVRDLPAERLIDIVQSAHGSYGPCIEYVLETARALKQSNIQDKRLQLLVRELHKSTTGTT